MNDRSIRKTVSSKLYYRACCFVLFFAASAASFNGYYDKYRLLESGTVNPEFKQTFEAMMDGTAPRPFVYRQLLPWMASGGANLVEQALPNRVKDWLYRGHNGKPVGERFFDSPIVNEPQYLLRYLLLYGIEFCFVLAGVYAIYALCNRMGYPRSASALTAIGTILIMPFLLSGGGYFYDYPELAFMVLAVWMAMRWRWWWMVPIVVLATWNKESFLLFLPSLYPILRRRSSRGGALAGVGVLLACGSAVYGALRARFVHNPGGTVEVHLEEQIQYLEHFAQSMTSPEKTYGLLTIKAVYLAAGVLVLLTAARGWRLLPQAIRRHGQIAAAINLPLYFVLCAPGELRDLSMMYVTLILLLGANLAEWTQEASAATPTW